MSLKSRTQIQIEKKTQTSFFKQEKVQGFAQTFTITQEVKKSYLLSTMQNENIQILTKKKEKLPLSIKNILISSTKKKLPFPHVKITQRF